MFHVCIFLDTYNIQRNMLKRMLDLRLIWWTFFTRMFGVGLVVQLERIGCLYNPGPSVFGISATKPRTDGITMTLALFIGGVHGSNSIGGTFLQVVLFVGVNRFIHCPVFMELLCPENCILGKSFEHCIPHGKNVLADIIMFCPEFKWFSCM